MFTLNQLCFACIITSLLSVLDCGNRLNRWFKRRQPQERQIEERARVNLCYRILFPNSLKCSPAVCLVWIGGWLLESEVISKDSPLHSLWSACILHGPCNMLSPTSRLVEVEIPWLNSHIQFSRVIFPGRLVMEQFIYLFAWVTNTSPSWKTFVWTHYELDLCVLKEWDLGDFAISESERGKRWGIVEIFRLKHLPGGSDRFTQMLFHGGGSCESEDLSV